MLAPCGRTCEVSTHLWGLSARREDGMPMRQRSAALLIIGIGLLIAGCGDDTSPSVMATDSGVDSSLVLVMDGSAPNEASTSNEASSSGPDCGTSVGVNVAT